VDPFHDGRNDVYNFFFVIGPGRTSRAEATAVLSTLPPTDAALVVPSRIPADIAPLAILIAVAVASFMLAAGHFDRRGSGDIPTP
jgi:hypothetical protein